MITMHAIAQFLGLHWQRDRSRVESANRALIEREDSAYASAQAGLERMRAARKAKFADRLRDDIEDADAMVRDALGG